MAFFPPDLFCLLPSQTAKVHTHGQSNQKRSRTWATLTRHVVTPEKWYQAKQGTRYQRLPPHHSPVRHRGCLLTSCQLHNRCPSVFCDLIMQFIKYPTYINAKWNKISINISQKQLIKMPSKNKFQWNCSWDQSFLHFGNITWKNIQVKACWSFGVFKENVKICLKHHGDSFLLENISK